MFRVFNCLTVEHDWRLVLLAVLICFLTSLAAINLFHRARAASGRAQLAWLATAGITTGCGIWATHFIAMLAYEPGIPVAYNVGLTALSLMAAAAITSLGFAVSLAVPGRWAALVGGVVVGAGVGAMHYTGCGRSRCRDALFGICRLLRRPLASGWSSARRHLQAPFAATRYGRHLSPRCC
jgi:NO-binding membrane sensor protein with MHYT domain